MRMSCRSGKRRAISSITAAPWPPNSTRPTGVAGSRPNARRAAARRALGLDPATPVGLVLFGGQGAAVMLDIARRLPDRQLILICGHNQKLRAQLERLPRRAPVFIEGFTKEIPRYMQLADYFIGKPGPGSISEAVF